MFVTSNYGGFLRIEVAHVAGCNLKVGAPVGYRGDRRFTRALSQCDFDRIWVT